MYVPPMLRWSWLVAGAAFACSSPQRQFSETADNGGAAGQPRANGESGRATGGTAGSSAGSGPIGAHAGASGGDAANGDAGSGSAGGAAGSDAMTGDAGMAGSDEEPACSGCRIGARCVGNGTPNPDNSCELCDVARSRDSYSPNTGKSCGSSATECSAQDTCDERAVCQKNDQPSGTRCAGGACQMGVCKANPFDCIAPNPPAVSFPMQIYEAIGVPAAATGGAIADGRYTAKRVDLYDSSAVGIDLRTFEFKGGFVQAALQYRTVDTGVGYIPEVRFSGTFTTTGSLLKFNLERCDPNYDLSIPNLTYTATANGMITVEKLANGTTVVISYLRE